MRILVPLDGSPQAEYALGPAAQLARHAPHPTTLILMRVETILPMIITPAGMGVHSGAVPVTDRDECVTYLMDLTLHPTLLGLDVEWRVASGADTDAICVQAQAMRVDLIVLTSHGRAGLARAALGSVAEGVAQYSHIPTLVLRLDAAAFAPHPPHAPFTILVALDGSSLAEATLPAASLIARAMQGAIVLVQVLTPRTVYGENERELVDDANAYLVGLQQQLGKEGISATCVVAWGDPAAEISATATAQTCDLIAIATHGRSGVTRMVLGSVAAQVLQQFHPPLLIINPLR